MRVAFFDCGNGISTEAMLAALCAAQDGFKNDARQNLFVFGDGARLRCTHAAAGQTIGRAVEIEYPRGIEESATVRAVDIDEMIKPLIIDGDYKRLTDMVFAVINSAYLKSSPSARRTYARRDALTRREAYLIGALTAKLMEMGIEKICYLPMCVNETLSGPATINVLREHDVRFSMADDVDIAIDAGCAAILAVIGAAASPDFDTACEGAGIIGDAVLKATVGEVESKDRLPSVQDNVHSGEAKNVQKPDEGVDAGRDTGTGLKAAEAVSVSVIECNIDDMSPEQLAYACEKLMAEGALDVWQTPIIMKKGRMAAQLSVLCKAIDVDKYADIVLRETTTLGVRIGNYARRVLPRTMRTVDTAYGEIRVKAAPNKAAPEYEDCKSAALRFNIPIMDVYDVARAADAENREVRA